MVRVNFGQIKEWFDAVLGVSFGVKKLENKKMDLGRRIHVFICKLTSAIE